MVIVVIIAESLLMLFFFSSYFSFNSSFCVCACGLADGLGFSTDEIGTALGAVSIPLLFIQLKIYPQLVAKFGIRKVSQTKAALHACKISFMQKTILKWIAALFDYLLADF